MIWLKQNGYYDAVRAGVESRGRDLARELRSMYVSPFLAQSTLDAVPELGTTPPEVLGQLRAQYPSPDDITDEEFVALVSDVLALQSTSPGKATCTLVIFDELQQFIGDDGQRTNRVQDAAEACSKRFGSQLLFVATGQAALQATPQLARLRGRFTVPVMLSDRDVEQVVREVVLRKRPDQEAALKADLTLASGEIDRHLAGTKIGPTPADAPELVPDYPLLPARRRFWEAVLRAVDTAGTVGQLRTQLRIVHETTRAVAPEPVGTVVPGDAIYGQLAADMLTSGALLRDIHTTIQKQDDGTPDGVLRARLCSAIFLVNKLPTDGVAATGVRATVDVLADLLVSDLKAGSAGLRSRIPTLLAELVEAGTLMLVGDEYRLQTREGAEWEADHRNRYARIVADDARVASERADELRVAVAGALKGISLVHGASRTPRKYELHFGATPPPADGSAVPVWVRDEWSATESTVRQEAQAAGVESPTVFVFLPRRDSDALRQAIARHAAAKEVVESRAPPTTDEGREAKSAMQSRLMTERERLDGLVAGVVGGGRVFQGGGNELLEGSLQSSARAAITAALARLFPDFDLADHPGWGTVVTKASQGAGDALEAVGYRGEVEKHPACQRIRAYVGGAGKKGAEVRRHFTGRGYGWPQDAVDGTLLILVGAGLVRAARNGQAVAVKEISRTQIGQTDFVAEGVTIGVNQRLEIRSLLAGIGFRCNSGEEGEAVLRMLERMAELAGQAGGAPPRPEPPSLATIPSLRALAGNEQLAAVHAQRDQLLTDHTAWSLARQALAERAPRWELLRRLLKHAETLPAAAAVAPQIDAISANRSLLADPDPVTPLFDQLAGALRAELQAARTRLVDLRDRELTALAATSEWAGLPEADRERLLADSGLGPISALEVGDDHALLTTLDATPLADWDVQAAALPARVASVRDQAAQLLEPKSVRIPLPSATLIAAAEVDTYLDQLRAEIMREIEAGHPVLI